MPGDFDPLAATSPLALKQRRQDADCRVQTSTRVADIGSRFEWPAVSLTRNAECSADGLRNHVEGQEFAIRALGCEAFDLGIDDARVDPRDLCVVEAQAIDCAGRKVLDEHVAVFDECAK